MNLVAQLALGRIAIGSVAVARPETAVRFLKLDAGGTGAPVYLTRLAGVRDLALGVATLLAPRGARKALLGLGMAVDGSDAYAGYEAYRNGTVPQSTALLLTAPAVAAVLAGAVGMAEKKPGKSPAREA